MTATSLEIAELIQKQQRTDEKEYIEDLKWSVKVSSSIVHDYLATYDLLSTMACDLTVSHLAIAIEAGARFYRVKGWSHDDAYGIAWDAKMACDEVFEARYHVSPRSDFEYRIARSDFPIVLPFVANPLYLKVRHLRELGYAVTADYGGVTMKLPNYTVDNVPLMR
jgi:hypothetical protein